LCGTTRAVAEGTAGGRPKVSVIDGVAMQRYKVGVVFHKTKGTRDIVIAQINVLVGVRDPEVPNLDEESQKGTGELKGRLMTQV
jgi:hypothetical protein